MILVWKLKIKLKIKLIKLCQDNKIKSIIYFGIIKIVDDISI